MAVALGSCAAMDKRSTHRCSIFFTIILSVIVALIEYRRERKQSREEKDKNAQ